MKVCSLYGAGYYYMPGSDICLKLGGYVRYQFTVNPGANISAGPLNGPGARHTRIDSTDTAHRTRAVVTVDTRQQTAYGTLRTYTLLGFQQDSTVGATTSPNVYMTRGFLQIAGFTFGKATSFFDIMPGASFAYNAGFLHHPDTGDAGQMVAAYTAQFGNGFSATISAEQTRKSFIVNTAASTAANPAFAFGAPNYNNSLGSAGFATSGGVGNSVLGTGPWPDIVANLRVDQAWGSVLVSGAIKDASAGYYAAVAGQPAPLAANGHPGNEIGWAISGGAIFNLPMIARGDRFAFQATYTEGAIRYASITPSGSGFMGGFDGGIGFGYFTDGVFGATGGVELTTAWSLSAAFEHFWTPALRTSVYGSYLDVSHNGNARTLICGATGGVFGGAGGGLAAGCNPDWSTWNLGTRTQWEPVRGLIMGVDVVYQHLNTATTATGLASGGGSVASPGALGAGPYVVRDQDSWTGTFRIQRDFLP